MGCPPKVRSALESVDGVETVEVDFQSKTATVTCSSGCDEAKLISALEEANFGGEVKGD
jgi:copper chaperone CopZ